MVTYFERLYWISPRNRQLRERRGQRGEGENEVERVVEDQGCTRPWPLARDCVQHCQAVRQRIGSGTVVIVLSSSMGKRSFYSLLY